MPPSVACGPAMSRVLFKLTGIKNQGDYWIARYSAHDDKIQSLQVSERTDGSVGLHCHAGCDKMPIVSSLGLTFSDLFAAEKKVTKQIVATYDYQSLDGTLLYQAVRFHPKEFRQRRPDATGKWLWDMKPLKGQHVCYRLGAHSSTSIAAVRRRAARARSAARSDGVDMCVPCKRRCRSMSSRDAWATAASR